MNPEFEQYVSRLERLLTLLKALAAQFVASRNEFVAMNLDGIYRCIAEQEELCRQIQLLLASSEGFRICAPENQDQEVVLHMRALKQSLREACDEVAQLKQVHAAYLRRSSRTLDVLLNAVGSHALTYTRPVESPLASSPALGN